MYPPKKRSPLGGIRRIEFLTDQEHDSETGLYNYDARFYDPALRMFISPDPVTQDVYDPQFLNPYAYCRNNPIVNIDPSGNVTIDEEGRMSSATSDALAYNDILANDMQSSWSSGDYLGATASGLLYGMNSISLVPGGFAFDTVVGGPWNSGVDWSAGWVHGDYDKQFSGSLNLLAMGLAGRMFPGAPKGNQNNVAWADGGVGLADDLLRYKDNLIPKEGFTDVMIHAKPNYFAVLHKGEWVKMTHRTVANFLKTKGVQGNLRLISCEAGQANLAQNLANKMGVVVQAATTKVGILKTGVSHPIIFNGGVWKYFKPGG